jgi:hypothetical protein
MLCGAYWKHSNQKAGVLFDRLLGALLSFGKRLDAFGAQGLARVVSVFGHHLNALQIRLKLAAGGLHREATIVAKLWCLTTHFTLCHDAASFLHDTVTNSIRMRQVSQGYDASCRQYLELSVKE